MTQQSPKWNYTRDEPDEGFARLWQQFIQKYLNIRAELKAIKMRKK